MNDAPALPKVIRVPTTDLQHLFDIATQSMDFGSGFLDNEEVDVLRRIAVALGQNPMVGTPSNFNKTYAHAFEPYERVPGRCYYCSSSADESWHRVDATTEIVSNPVTGDPLGAVVNEETARTNKIIGNRSDTP